MLRYQGRILVKTKTMPRNKDDPNFVPDQDFIDDDQDRDCIEPRLVRKPKKRQADAQAGNGATCEKYKKDASDVQSNGIAQPPLRVAAFNIQIFGKKKMRNEEVVGVLVKIIQRYDLVLVQEIRDSSETAMEDLVEELNRADSTNPFACTVSSRLGRTGSKEQYGFVYRTQLVTVADQYQFDDGVDDGTDVFQREPFALRFNCPSTEVNDFAIIAIHTAPKDAVNEVANLHKVYEAARDHWKLEDILIAGDFNADEGYVDNIDWCNIPLRTDKKFKWLIDDIRDTTTGNTDRAYDRFVATGNRLVAGIVRNSAKVFKFDKEYGLDYERAKAVSDHYPIEMKLKGKINRQLQDQLETNVSVVIQQKTPMEKESLARKIYKADAGQASANFATHVVHDDSRMVEVVAIRENVLQNGVCACLEEFRAAFPGVVSPETVTMAGAHINSEYLAEGPYVYGMREDCAGSGVFSVEVRARLQDPLTVGVRITRKMN